MLGGPINSVAVALRMKTRKRVPSLREQRARVSRRKSRREKELRTPVTFLRSFIYHPADDIIDDRERPRPPRRCFTACLMPVLSSSSNLNVKFYCLLLDAAKLDNIDSSAAVTPATSIVNGAVYEP